MNTTIDHLDRTTHFKILTVALLGAAIVFAVARSARSYPAQTQTQVGGGLTVTK